MEKNYVQEKTKAIQENLANKNMRSYLFFQLNQNYLPKCLTSTKILTNYQVGYD